jgi:hypothetical protein
MKRRQSRVARSLTLLRGRALYARVSLLTGWRSMRASTICCRGTDGPKNLMPDPLSTGSDVPRSVFRVRMEVQRTAPERHSSMFLAIVSLRSWAACNLHTKFFYAHESGCVNCRGDRRAVPIPYERLRDRQSQTRFGTRRGAAQAGNRMIRTSVENPRYDDGRWPPRTQRGACGHDRAAT